MREFDLDADRLQSALTKRFLIPALSAIEATFLALRAEADVALSEIMGARYGKPYPHGMCLEITNDVVARLGALPARPRSAGERALTAFFARGGVGRMVWGVLRDSYFQNAILLGSLYVDVSNDTVDPRKSKVEILPIRDSGLVLVKDAAHFTRIGARYWDVRFYANTALPSLAPAFPLIAVDREGRTQIQHKSRYMMRLFGADGFRLAEQCLLEGPLPPSSLIQTLRAACSPELLAANPHPGVSKAVQACERLRADGIVADDAWVTQMQGLFDHAPPARIAAAPTLATRVPILDGRRANTRHEARIQAFSS